MHDYQMPDINVILSLIRTSYTRKRYLFSYHYFFKLYFFIIFYLLYFSAYSENDAFVCVILGREIYTVLMLGQSLLWWSLALIAFCLQQFVTCARPPTLKMEFWHWIHSACNNLVNVLSGLEISYIMYSSPFLHSWFLNTYEGRSICNENSPVNPKVLYLHTS